MSRILITGAGGFLGRHLTELCVATGHDVFGVFRSHDPGSGASGAVASATYFRVDLSDFEATSRMVADCRPDLVCHLAGQSSTTRSWEDPQATYRDNVFAQVSLLEACAAQPSVERILVASSAEVYGAPGPAENPVTEDRPPAPYSPYGASKVAQEVIAAQYVRSRGMKIDVVRPFLQIGPGRSDRFFSGMFARQIAEIERGIALPTITVGEIDIIRDMTDVRDVARACLAVMLCRGESAKYNIASGQGRTLRDLLCLMLDAAGVEAEIAVSSRDARRLEPRVLIGANSKLRAATGWEPRLPIETSALDLLEYWRNRMAAVP